MRNCSPIAFIKILTVLSIILISCTPKNPNEAVQYSELPSTLDDLIESQVYNNDKIDSISNELSTVGWQEFNLPPQIDLIRHSNFAESFHPVRYARIWGWSANGRVAYSIEGGLNSETSYRIDFVILDLITNNVLFNFTDFSVSANNWVEGDALFYVHKTSILDALRTYEIIDQRTDFLPFPLIKNNIAYYAEIIDIEYGEDEYWQLGDTILRYTLSLTVDNGREIIDTFTPFLWLHNVDVCGYFLSPFENIILAIIAEDLGQYQHGGILYRFVGLNLEESFN